MKNVFITMRLVDKGEFDMEFPSDIPLGEIVSQLVRYQGWDVRNTTYEIQYEGKTIHPNKTMAELDLWNGTELVLHPRYSALTPLTTEESVAGGTSSQKFLATRA